MSSGKDSELDYWNNEITWSAGRKNSLGRKHNNINCKIKRTKITKKNFFLGLLKMLSPALLVIGVSLPFYLLAPNNNSDALQTGIIVPTKDYLITVIPIMIFFFYFIIVSLYRGNYRNALANGKKFHGVFETIEKIEESKTLLLENSTREQVSEIADELNKLKKAGNKKEYMKIIEKILKSDEKVKERLRIESKEKALKEKKDKFEKIKKNPYLNGTLYTNELQELSKEFTKNNGGSFSKDFEKKLFKVAEEIDELYARNKNNKLVKDCRSELLEVTRKYYEVTVDGGILTSSEVNNYENLVNTCEKVIGLNLTKELTMELDNSAQVSSIYLRDKYGV